jgi:hypothetical protein
MPNVFLCLKGWYYPIRKAKKFALVLADVVHGSHTQQLLTNHKPLKSSFFFFFFWVRNLQSIKVVYGRVLGRMEARAPNIL